MRDAGRIGFDIKGNYDSTMKYEFLDVVYYQNSSYVAKKETTGNLPADNNEFWQILARGESSGGDADASDMTVEFEQAVTMTNISTGEKLSSLFGKIKKWFTELPGTRVVGSILTLTDFSQLNNTYRYWKISTIDAAYAEEIGIRNVGDFWAFILSYNGDGNTFHFGNIILTSPRLANNDYYKITMWDGIPNVTLSRGYVPSLTNNFLATVPGQSALDAALGPVLKGTLDDATISKQINNPSSKDELLEKIIEIYTNGKSASVPVSITCADGSKIGAANGNYIGVLTNQYNHVVGNLISYWNPLDRIMIAADFNRSTRSIDVKYMRDVVNLQQQINQLNSDLLRWKSFPAAGTGSIEINVSDKLPARAQVISAINSFIPGAGEYHVVGFSDNTSTLFFNKIVPSGTLVSITVIYILIWPIAR